MLTGIKDKFISGGPDAISTRSLTAFIALVYPLVGAFGLMLAIGPGYASPIFPAAGLALAVALLFGPRALPGVWLGSFVMNMAVALMHGTLNPATTTLALLIAVGATAQAWAGSSLVNGWQKSVWRKLERELDAFIFLLLGGVLACLLSPAVGVAGLYVTGVIKPGDAFFSYWNWYVGDTLGVLIFAPLLLLLLRRPAEDRSDRQRYAFVPMLVVMGLLWLAFYGATRMITRDKEDSLKHDCEIITKRIADRLLTHREVLASLRNFIEATPNVSFRQFEQFTNITLQDNPDIFALSFNDLVAHDQRPLYERKMSALSPLGRFQITERDSQKMLVSAAERPEYVAVRYIVPLAGNQPAVGFDIHSEPVRREAINCARNSGSMAVTSPIQLVQEQKKRVGVLELMPVVGDRESGDLAQNALNVRRLTGFAVSVVKIDEVIDIATRGHVPTGLQFLISDRHAPNGRELLYCSGAWGAGNRSSDRTEGWKTALRMGDREWEFAASASDVYLQQHRPLLAWATGGIAIVITGLIQLLIIGMNGRMSEVRRTHDAVNAHLDNLFNYANVPIIVWDSAGRITRFSKAFEGLTGRRAEDVVNQDIAVIFGSDGSAGPPELLQKIFAGEHWESVELPVVHVNGTLSTVLWNASSIYGEAGATTVATIAQGHDITARKKMEVELQQRTCDLGNANAQLEQEITERQLAQEELAAKQAQLEVLNNSLQQRIAGALVELRQKDQMMISQGRQAAMGEMIGNIAHQWRQPLNALALVFGNIRMAYQHNALTLENLNEKVENGNRLIQKMSSTINDFRNFFLPDREKVRFSARVQILHATGLVEAGLTSENIRIHLDAPVDAELTGFPNEYSQVLLNLLVNAKEAIKDSGVPDGHIRIRLFERDGRACVSVSDNGGGIPADVLEKIFEPYFSTKKMGTGIGLYMSKMIIERSMSGAIEAHNKDGGAEFVVVTPRQTGLT
ncbi:MAG: CHASE domain-containing protein [bacterium]